jgi:predicted Zn finger-like uncharacterized protein
MNVTCEKCGARFFVDEAKLKKDVIHKKCPKCGGEMIEGEFMKSIPKLTILP